MMLHKELLNIMWIKQRMKSYQMRFYKKQRIRLLPNPNTENLVLKTHSVIISAMTALKIIRLGNPILRKKSTPVSLKALKSKSFQKFLDDMAKTCVKNNGAGIAAPQVGKNIRAIVVHVDPKNPRYPNKKPFPLTVVINPGIVEKSKEK